MYRYLLAAPAAAVLFAASAYALEDRVLDFPADYRKTFENYMISDRLGQDDQVISLFANRVARDSARAGGRMADGSVLVGEIYAAVKDADGIVVESPLGRRVAGEMKAIVVMERRADWADQYAQDMKLGGWEFEVFSPSGENLGKDTAGCRACHAGLPDTDFTFSQAHIGAAD